MFRPLRGEIIEGATVGVEWCLLCGFQQRSAGWVVVIDLPAEGDGDDGGRAGVFEGVGHGLGSRAGDPQVFEQEDPSLGRSG
jgi:hypothetical protein